MIFCKLTRRDGERKENRLEVPVERERQRGQEPKQLSEEDVGKE